MVYGAKVLMSARVAAFRSKLVKSLWFLLRVKQVFTSSRHFETNNKMRKLQQEHSKQLTYAL